MVRLLFINTVDKEKVKLVRVPNFYLRYFLFHLFTEPLMIINYKSKYDCLTKYKDKQVWPYESACKSPQCTYSFSQSVIFSFFSRRKMAMECWYFLIEILIFITTKIIKLSLEKYVWNFIRCFRVFIKHFQSAVPIKKPKIIFYWKKIWNAKFNFLVEISKQFYS